MDVRIIGPAEELGIVETLTVFGNVVRRDKWTKVEVTAEQARKLEANPYFETRGAKVSDKDPDAQRERAEDTAELDNIRARLDELGVAYPAKASPAKLNALLDKAEADKADAEAAASAQA